VLKEGEWVRVWNMVMFKVLALNNPAAKLLGIADSEGELAVI
jgi:hypothetical protein